ncbi:MAG: hypothetical protein AB1656_15170, partial [Candidatus Omnitrophota bacterium]
MNRNQETAQRILQEILEGRQELSEEAIRALVQEDPEAAVLLILEEAHRLLKDQAAKEAQKIAAPSGMVPPYEKPAKKGRKKKRGRKPGHPGACRKKPHEITHR